MMPKSKSLFMLSGLKFGGAEKQTIELINRLDTTRLEIGVCYLEREEQLKCMIRGEQVSFLYCLEKSAKVDFGVLRRLRKVAMEFEPDTIVCVDPYAGFYANMLRIIFLKNFRIIQVIHSTLAADLHYDRVTRLIYRPLINRSDHVVFVSKNQMNYWIAHYGIRSRHATYIYNGVDVDHFSDVGFSGDLPQIRQSLGFAQSDVVLCICAAFRPEKRHVDLIDAGRLLRDRGLPVKLLFVGDGVERDNVERRMVDNDMKTSVVITGFQHDVRSYIAASDIVAMPSSSVETFSIAILEAMAMGKPIVASDIGGASEQVLNGKNGFLFPPRNVSALAEKLEIIIRSELFESMGKASRLLVMDRFSVGKMVEQYQTLLAS